MISLAHSLQKIHVQHSCVIDSFLCRRSTMKINFGSVFWYNKLNLKMNTLLEILGQLPNFERRNLNPYMAVTICDQLFLNYNQLFLNPRSQIKNGYHQTSKTSKL
ncbi:Hypothetical_protein [Hexamita inflata]|uniref:Hypothetical_protein n=1 Tax=Hexamita inflata TaxID=28002 RepID=A0AA86NEU0_9EUKA|nr:Hypothetical protein HINF_LOCUS5494 [Hexamita inflata]